MFNERLREVREKSGKTQVEFAKLLDISVPSQTNYERGIRIPDISYLKKLNNLGFDAYYLLTGIPLSLSSEEVNLLTVFRKLNAENKAIVRATIESIHHQSHETTNTSVHK